jgi:hypothetical protein
MVEENQYINIHKNINNIFKPITTRPTRQMCFKPRHSSCRQNKLDNTFRISTLWPHSSPPPFTTLIILVCELFSNRFKFFIWAVETLFSWTLRHVLHFYTMITPSWKTIMYVIKNFFIAMVQTRLEDSGRSRLPIDTNTVRREHICQSRPRRVHPDATVHYRYGVGHRRMHLHILPRQTNY